MTGVGTVLFKIVFRKGFSEVVTFKPNLKNEKEPVVRKILGKRALQPEEGTSAKPWGGNLMHWRNCKKVIMTGMERTRTVVENKGKK